MAVTKRYAVYCRGELIGEYTFEVVEPEEKAVRPWPKCDDWSEERERTRQMFLCSGLDLSRIPIRPGAGWR